MAYDDITASVSFLRVSLSPTASLSRLLVAADVARHTYSGYHLLASLTATAYMAQEYLAFHAGVLYCIVSAYLPTHS